MFKYLRNNQKGFTLVELMVVIVIIGVLAAVAVPKFTDSITQGNTAKIASDLRSIDSAVHEYEAANAKLPAAIGDLTDYLAATPVPPKTGQVYLKSAATDIDGTDAAYSLVGGIATFTNATETYTAGDVHK